MSRASAPFWPRPLYQCSGRHRRFMHHVLRSHEPVCQVSCFDVSRCASRLAPVRIDPTRSATGAKMGRFPSILSQSWSCQAEAEMQHVFQPILAMPVFRLHPHMSETSSRAWHAGLTVWACLSCCHRRTTWRSGALGTTTRVIQLQPRRKPSSLSSGTLRSCLSLRRERNMSMHGGVRPFAWCSSM